jgi:hypothetical protein
MSRQPAIWAASSSSGSGGHAAIPTAAAARFHTSAHSGDASDGNNNNSSSTSSEASTSAPHTTTAATAGRARPALRSRPDAYSGYSATTVRGDGPQRPGERLKVRLREDNGDDASQQQAQEAADAAAALDLFSLSRTLGEEGGGGAAAGGAGDAAAAAAARRVLGADEQRTLSKLIGCLTKEGKRSRAQRVVGDALQIINAQLRKGSAAAGGSGGGKGR